MLADCMYIVLALGNLGNLTVGEMSIVKVDLN